jgi:hypothetical protein
MVAAIGAKTAVVSTSVGLAHEDLEPLASAGHAGRCVIASHFRGPRLPLLIDGPRRPELGLGHHLPDRGDTLQGVLQTTARRIWWIRTARGTFAKQMRLIFDELAGLSASAAAHELERRGYATAASGLRGARLASSLWLDCVARAASSEPSSVTAHIRPAGRMARSICARRCCSRFI